MILLDSDTLTHLIYGKANFEVRLEIARANSMVALPVFVRAEVLRGRLDGLLTAGKSESIFRQQEQLANTEDYLKQFKIIHFDAVASEVMARLVRLKGLKKTGLADLLIACICLANQATLVTCNTKDYEAIPNLKLENWSN